MKDKKYMDWLKTLPCHLCGKESEPHHIPRDGHGAMGMKTSDRRALNLCHDHHYEYHSQGKKTFATKYSMDYEFVLGRLNDIWEQGISKQKDIMLESTEEAHI